MYSTQTVLVPCCVSEQVHVFDGPVGQLQAVFIFEVFSILGALHQVVRQRHDRPGESESG